MRQWSAWLKYCLCSSHWRHTWKRAQGTALPVFGGIDLISSVSARCSPPFDQFLHTWTYFIVVTFISGMVGLWMLLRPKKIVRNITGVDVPVRIVIADAIHRKGDCVVACNTTFDTSYDNGFVSRESFQGQIQHKYYPRISRLDQELDRELCKYSGVQLTDGRKQSKDIRYPPGTVVKTLPDEGRNIYWAALADATPAGTASCTIGDLRNCLRGLWDYLSKNGHKTTLVMPVLGSGRSGMNASRETIIKEILFSFIAYSRNHKIVEALDICIGPQDVLDHAFDWDALEIYLRYHCSENSVMVEEKSTSHSRGIS